MAQDLGLPNSGFGGLGARGFGVSGLRSAKFGVDFRRTPHPIIVVE